MKHSFGRTASCIFLLACLVSSSLLAQPPGWNDPYPPHKVMDNLYYVGTAQLGSFLITSPEGISYTAVITRAQFPLSRLP